MEENINNIDNLPETEVFQEMIEVSIEIDKFLRMKRLQSENQQIQGFDEAENGDQMELEQENATDESEDSNTQD